MRVAVIGAGVAGLSAARALRRQGVEVTVYEASDRAGGVLRSSVVDHFVHEHAANGFLGDVAGGAIDLARELGVVLEEASPAARRRWIFVGGKLRELPSNPVAFLRSDLLTWRGKLAAMAEPLRPRRNLADESIGDFARRRLGDEAADRIVAPFVTGIFAGRSDQLSVRAAFPQLAELEDRGGLVRGGLARLVEARRQRRQEAGRRRAGRGTRLAAPVGGVEALVEALADDLHPVMRLGALVDSVQRDGAAVVVHAKPGGPERFDAAVLATPAYAAATIVRAASPPLAATLEAIPYAPIAVVYLGFDRARIEHPLDGFGFLVAEGEPMRMLGTVFESVLWSGRAPAGKVLLRCMFGGGRDPDAVSLSDDELVATAQRDLEGPLGLRGRAQHSAVVRWPRGIAQYTLGHADRVARAEELARPLGLVLCGSAYHAVAVNKLVADAKRVVREVLARAQPAVAALVLLAFAAVLAGCGGKGRAVGPAEGDGGDASARADEPDEPTGPYQVATGADGRVENAGRVEVSVQWVTPPAELLRSPGRNECGTQRRPALDVHTMHGVRGAVVSLGVAQGKAPGEAAPAELSLRDCRFDAAVTVASALGAPVEVVNLDARRHQVEVSYLGPRGAAAPEALGALPLPVVGHRRAVDLERPGVFRFAGSGEGADVAWVIAPAHPYVLRTNDRGVARFDEVPAGSYAVQVWHPPLGPGQAPRVVRGRVDVVAGQEAELVIALEGETAADEAGDDEEEEE